MGAFLVSAVRDSEDEEEIGISRGRVRRDRDNSTQSGSTHESDEIGSTRESRRDIEAGIEAGGRRLLS